jgi:hypothetical protein
MGVIVRSLINQSQTIDSVALPAWATQTRDTVTSALTAAQAAGDVQLDVVDDPSAKAHGDETEYEFVPLTGGTVQIPSDAEFVSIKPAGGLAALTLDMPLTPYPGQRVSVSFDQAITTLTMAAPGTGQTLKGALTAATAQGFGTWRYRASNKTWYRVA